MTTQEKKAKQSKVNDTQILTHFQIPCQRVEHINTLSIFNFSIHQNTSHHPIHQLDKTAKEKNKIGRIPKNKQNKTQQNKLNNTKNYLFLTHRINHQQKRMGHAKQRNNTL